MKTTITNRRMGAIILVLCVLQLTSAAVVTPDLRDVPAGKGWAGATSVPKLIDKDGAPALEFNKKGARTVWLDGFEFDEGTIEFDAKGKSEPRGSGFIGVAFRGVGEKIHDVVYFRPFNFRAADAQRKIHAVQYCSEPSWPWHRLRKEKTGQYEKPIEPAPDGDVWFHAKVVIAKRQVKVYVNGAAEPALAVKELSERRGGKFGIWCNGYGAFANLRITTASSQAGSCGEGRQTKDWPHYLGPNYDLQPQLKAFAAKSASDLWRAQVKTGMCSISVADGLVYTMGNNGTKDKKAEARDIVYCLDASTGEIKWTFDYACQLDPRLHPGGPSATPTVHDGKVYTCSKFGHLYCLDARTGAKVWEYSAEHYKPRAPWWGFAASPTIIGDVVIYNIGDRGLALDRATGEVIWKSDGSVVAYATPVPLPQELFGRPAVSLLTNRAFLVLDPATGKSIATYAKTWEEKSNCNGITPYLHQGRIYFIHSAHGMACLSLQGKTIKQDWLSTDAKYPHEWFAFATHFIHNDDIYFLTKNRKPQGTGLYCIDAKTGKRKSLDAKHAFGNLLGVGDKLLMLSEEGELIWGTLSQSGFEESFRKKILEGLCWAKPVLTDGRLYARDAQGTVVCLRLE